jgi:hypothetical protein
MQFRTIIVRALALVALVPLACSSSSTSSSGGTGTPSAKAVAVPPALAGAQVKAASAAYAAQVDVVKIASNGYTVDLTTALPPLETSGPQADALARAVRAQAAWLTTASALGGPSPAGGLKTLTVRLRSTERTGTARSAIFGLDDALIVAGLALAAWGASKGVQKAVQIRTEPTSLKIQSASAGDLKVINSSLGLPATATKEEAKKAFDERGMGARLSTAKAIEQDLRLAETNRAPDVNSIPAEQLQRAVAESSVECGKTALKATVSASTFSGQGYTQVAQALGASAKAAGVIDLTISAVSEATDTPLQPLDVLAKHLEGSAASLEKTSVVVPAIPAGMTADAASTVLTSSDPTLSDFAAAIDAKIRSVIDALATAIGAITKGDGTLTVNAPLQIHQVLVDDAKNVQTVQVRDLGPASLLVSTDCHGSQVFTVDTSAPAKVDYSIAQNTCTTGDCAADLQLVDPYVTLPAACERCINSTCGSQCLACDPACATKVDDCYTRCSDAYSSCTQGCPGCSGDGCEQACRSACSGTETSCNSACGAMPEAARSDAIGQCIQGPCGEACASAMK